MGSGCGRTLITVYTGMLWTQLSTSFHGNSGIAADDSLRILALVRRRNRWGPVETNGRSGDVVG